VTVEDVASRLLNPAVIVTMIGSGIAYGWFLWSLHARPHARLWATGVMPGLVFVAVIWAIRAAQGVVALTYLALIIDWLIFSVTGVLTVLIARRIRRRRQP
jgi:hypothetical protein